jgi:hypothetical protein
LVFAGNIYTSPTILRLIKGIVMSSNSALIPMSSLSARFIDDIFNELKQSLNLNEVQGGDKGPLHTFHFPHNQQPAGHLRILDGGNHPHLLKVIQLSLDFGMVGADANALHIITKPNSLVPHCSVEYIHYDAAIDVPRNPAVQAGVDQYGCYINLISRVDAASNQAYLHHVYDPVHEGVVAIKSHAEIHNPVLPLWQAACFQPWIITAMAPAQHFPLLQNQGRTTIDHALSMHANGIPDSIVTENERNYCAERDRLNRLLLNSPEVDAVWPRIARLVGENDAARLREILSGQTVEKSF